jgi:hypothetical protein
MQNKKTYIHIKLFCVLLALLFIFGCTQNDDAIILKGLKQQNAFLEKQIEQSKWILKYKAEGNYSARAYNKLYFKQDSVVVLFLKDLAESDKKGIDKKYGAFISRSNHYFDSANKQVATRFLPDDAALLMMREDSLLFSIKNDSLKRELIRQQVLQHYLVVSQLCQFSSSYGIRFDDPNCFGYRLSIEKNTSHFLLNLKSYDPRKIPYFENMEFVSLARNNKDGYRYSDDLTDVKTEIIEAKYEKDAIVLKTKPLSQGFYKIYCKKLSISDDGRIIKRDAEFDFEITESQ